MPTESSKWKTDASAAPGRHPPRQRWSWILYGLATVGILAVVGASLRSNRDAAEAVPLVAPISPTHRDRIAGRGLVESTAEEVRMSPGVPGLVKRVAVQVGSVVGIGDVLLEQDDRAVQSELRRQLANLHLLERREVESKVDVADKSDTFERQKRLAKEAIATAEELNRARFAFERAEAVLASTKAQVEAAKADVEDSRTKLELLTVRAPRTGAVLQINTRSGEYITTGASVPAMIIGSTERLQVRVDVDEENASRIVPGATAWGLPKGAFTNLLDLQFVRIEPYLIPKRSLSGESSERVDTRVLQVIYAFDRGTRRIYPGQQMDVWIADAEAR